MTLFWTLVLVGKMVNSSGGKRGSWQEESLNSYKSIAKVKENQSNVQNHLVEIQADDHDLSVNSDNENDDMLGYESKKYSDDEDTDVTNHAKDADGTNHLNMKLVKRGITRLYKFHREYGKPGETKIKIISWKKVDKESRDKLWDKIMEKSARGKMARSKNVYHHKMRRGRVNKDEEFIDDEIRPVRDKLKEADDKIKEGTLNLDDGTDAMTVVFGKEKGGYEDEWEVELHTRDVLVKKLSTEMTEKEVTPMGAYEVDETQSSVVVHDKDARIQKKSNGLVTSEKASKCKLWHLKKSNIVALGNNGLKTVKDGVGGFFAWPKNQVVLDEEVTPPTTIQKISDYNFAPKLQLKRKIMSLVKPCNGKLGWGRSMSFGTDVAAEYSHKWHNETSRTRSTKTFDGLDAIQAKLNNLRREIKNVNEKVYAAQDKDDHGGKELARTLIDIHIFVGNFSIILGFTIIDDMNTTSGVVLGMPFCKKFVSCQKIMEKFACRDKCERLKEE
uniref:Uncharacterized protein n=1 Tax=Tanacetum cinerariifolium TaxID=118510 RepID=A0A6L2KY40_TANCI|nr:hypothetical protein [Tanacetum cinerariifolium]